MPDETGEDINNHVLDNPHIFLDEIMRQAQESEIIRLSMHIREGKPLHTFETVNDEVMFVKQGEITSGMLTWADQILCATNNNRHKINAQMRQIKGFGDLPEIGDKVINLHNEWDIMSSKGNPLTNGIIGNIKRMEDDKMVLPFWCKVSTKEIPLLYLDITGDEEGETFDDIPCDYNQLITGKPTLDGRDEYQLISKLRLTPPLHVNYGYAITVWKAQGSEWNKILLFDEKWPFIAEDKRRYLYTGITRAVDKLVIVQN